MLLLMVKFFKLAKAETGVNYPPMYPNCRSTTIEHDPEEAQDWVESGKEMPENKRYKEWYDEQVKNYGEGHVERERKKAYNKLSDERQYKAYVERLGTNAPDTFKAFQNIEYS